MQSVPVVTLKILVFISNFSKSKNRSLFYSPPSHTAELLEKEKMQDLEEPQAGAGKGDTSNPVLDSSARDPHPIIISVNPTST